MKHIYVTVITLLLSTSLFAQVQFADSVLAFSTEYYPSNPGCTNSWAACHILGYPDVYPLYGDQANAWSPSTSSSQREFIVVGFANPIPLDAVHIYETFCPGGVDTLYTREAATGIWHMVWFGTAAYWGNSESRINTISFPMTSYDVDAVRIAINSPVVACYNQIDAVSIGGVVLSDGTVLADHDVKLFPNPSAHGFTVTAGGAPLQSLRVVDVLGRSVYESGNLQTSVVNVNAPLAKGIYAVEVNGTNFKKTVRFVKD